MPTASLGPLIWVLVPIVAFVLGSIPTALWVGRAVRGIDLRQHGSGNLGATNVYRVLGATWGVTVLLLDALKGALAVLLAQWLDAGSTPSIWLPILALLCAVLGHMFTPFAAWRGGKGVATAAGAWLALAPAALALALSVWILCFAITRIVSIGSILAGTALPIALAVLSPSPLRDPLVWFGLLIGALLVLRHRSNMVRLLRGEEKPLVLRGGGRGKGARR